MGARCAQFMGGQQQQTWSRLHSLVNSNRIKRQIIRNASKLLSLFHSGFINCAFPACVMECRPPKALITRLTASGDSPSWRKHASCNKGDARTMETKRCTETEKERKVNNVSQWREAKYHQNTMHATICSRGVEGRDGMTLLPLTLSIAIVKKL